jgi:hypothetical protein
MLKQFNKRGPYYKRLIIVFLYLVNATFTRASPLSLSSHSSIQQDSIEFVDTLPLPKPNTGYVSDSTVELGINDSLNTTLKLPIGGIVVSREVKTKRKKNWHIIDTAIGSNYLFFRPQRNMPNSNSIENTPITLEKKPNYHYLGIYLLFVIILVSFSRVFNYQMHLQSTAFFSRPNMRELLESGKEWFETEKTAPFILNIIFFSTWFVIPILQNISPSSNIISLFLVSCILVLILILFFRFLQLIISHFLNFTEIISAFTKISFNTFFVLGLVLFPTFLTLKLLFNIDLSNNILGLSITFGVIYIFKTLKTLIISNRFDRRQIIYLILYLCTLEIPIFISSIKWLTTTTFNYE